MLTDREVADVWSSLDRKDIMPYYRVLTRVLLVFGGRTKEARLSIWKEWDLDSWVWTVPQENSKTREKILRPIPEPLRDWIQTRHEQKISDLFMGELKSESAVSQIGRTLHRTFSHSESWSFHNLRRALSARKPLGRNSCAWLLSDLLCWVRNPPAVNNVNTPCGRKLA
ncbi:tyrosine-type recombinase/integrase [Yersinia pekkanenii]|uniref:tyrosine-type recombinase/integrase n=1 Tax=Yersinia pekkanenii TaxID=1288385 RepID=UPI00138F21FD|nr:tyrosine-type recombinase/integrase [Yersinia pekkanenii]